MRSVAIIEDEPNILFVLTYALRQAAMQVNGFTDPREGVRWLLSDAAQRVGVLLVDLRMPGLGGKEIIECLAAEPDRRDLTIFLMTGAVPAEDELPPEGAYQRRIDKPFDLDEVVAAVRGALTQVYALPLEGG